MGILIYQSTEMGRNEMPWSPWMSMGMVVGLWMSMGMLVGVRLICVGSILFKMGNAIHQ